MMMGDDFLTWLQNNLNRRGWKNADLARRAKVSEATVSRIMSGLRNPTWDFCAGVARAFGLLEDDVFRKAGLLPPAPPVSEEEEAGQILRRLPAHVRSAVMTMLRSLSDPKPPKLLAPSSNPGVAEPPAEYAAGEE